MKAIEQHYPLRERDQTALARLQKRLGLQPADYERIEQRALGEVKPTPKPQSSPPAPEPKPAPADELPLKTDKADYTKLRDILAAKQWREADKETYRLMITTVGKKEGGWFTSKELETFPCEDLRILDGLWVKYSGGRFGFSVQKKIWQDCGSPGPYDDNTRAQWEQFGDRVGWRKDGLWLSYSKLALNGTGELPTFSLVGVDGFEDLLMEYGGVVCEEVWSLLSRPGL